MQVLDLAQLQSPLSRSFFDHILTIFWVFPQDTEFKVIVGGRFAKSFLIVFSFHFTAA